ncbi:MAG: RNA polymerase sigma-70 factor [Tannerella sp.]|jgi:RNA polymerase sigma-70 factor (ECF subfamily)|nr:RNA polymerase sigma-70 factor [Tannerella sp.]
MENPDYFCVKCLKDGDTDAFEVLYKKYHRQIFYASLKLTLSEVLAQDVTQDVFLKIWEKRDSLDPNKNFAAFISTICRNAIFDIFKRATYEEDVKKELQQFAEVADDGQEDEEYHERYKELLNKAIAELPPQRRTAFELCKLQEKSYNEAAGLMNVSRSTIQDHIVKANKFIRDYVLSHG